MKLWLLRPIEKQSDDPWDPWYDRAFGFVVRAETEDAAREIANQNAGDENREWLKGDQSGERKPWMNPKYSTCVELSHEGEAELVIVDYHAA